MDYISVEFIVGPALLDLYMILHVAMMSVEKMGVYKGFIVTISVVCRNLSMLPSA